MLLCTLCVLINVQNRNYHLDKIMLPSHLTFAFWNSARFLSPSSTLFISSNPQAWLALILLQLESFSKAVSSIPKCMNYLIWVLCDSSTLNRENTAGNYRPHTCLRDCSSSCTDRGICTRMCSPSCQYRHPRDDTWDIPRVLAEISEFTCQSLGTHSRRCHWGLKYES